MPELQVKTWQDNFDALVAFVETTPDIKVSQNALSFFSEEAKADFYRLLDMMISSFATAYINQENLVDYEGIRAFRKTEDSLKERTGIEGIKVARTLEDYLTDPIISARKVLYEPFLGLLQQRWSLEEFEDRAFSLLAELFANLNRCVFEIWLTYTLLDRLEPVVFKGVALLDESTLIATDIASLEVGYQCPLKDFRLPEALFETSMGEVYAYKFEKSSEIDFYNTKSKCTDYTEAGNTAGLVCHRTLLLYRIDDSATIPILAQRSTGHLLTPALVVEHLSTSELGSETIRKQLRRRTLLFGEDMRLQVVLSSKRNQVSPEELLADFPFTLHIVDYEAPLLDCVLEPLIST